MSGRCLEGVWKVIGLCLVSGRFLKDFWKVYGRHQKVSGRCLEDVWRVDEGCLKGVWNKNPHLISKGRKCPMYLEGV